MNNPKTRQQWILDLLKGEPTLSYVDCFAKYSQNFAKTRRTFDKDWKKAQEQLKEYQDAINKAKLEESIKQEIKAVKRDILNKLDAQEILTKIAKGVATRVEDKIVVPSASERVKAVSELSKMQGWNDPIKQNVNNKITIEIVDES